MCQYLLSRCENLLLGHTTEQGWWTTAVGADLGTHKAIYTTDIPQSLQVMISPLKICNSINFVYFSAFQVEVTSLLMLSTAGPWPSWGLWAQSSIKSNNSPIEETKSLQSVGASPFGAEWALKHPRSLSLPVLSRAVSYTTFCPLLLSTTAPDAHSSIAAL